LIECVLLEVEVERMMFERSLSSLVALLALAATQACASSAQPSSDQENAGGAQTNTNQTPAHAGSGNTSSAGATGVAGGTNTNPTSGGAGGAFGASGSGGTTSGGSATSGAAGATVSSAGAGGASVGAAGASTGGTTGTAGASAGGGSGGTSDTTPFGQVQSLLGKRCAGSKCHSSTGMQLAFASMTGSALHSALTSPIPATAPHCVGVTLVTPNDTSSPLVEIVSSGGKIACTKPKAESIGPMPDKCTPTSTTDQCLTTTEIKVLTDWIAAGAPD
jgi:hypothetical protein